MEGDKTLETKKIREYQGRKRRRSIREEGLRNGMKKMK